MELAGLGGVGVGRSRVLVTTEPVTHRFSFRDANQLALGFLKNDFIYLFLAVLGLRCCASFSLVVAYGLSCSVACGIFRGQGSNLCLLHWQVDSLPLSYWGSPRTPKGANNPHPCWTAGGLRVDEGRRLAHGCTSSQGVSSAEPGSEPPAASRR